MNTYTFYDATGNIRFIYSGFCLETMVENYSDLKYIFGSYDGNKYYILNNIIKERPIQNTILDKIQISANGIDILTIADAPIGEITIYGFNSEKSIVSNINNTETFITTIPDTYQIYIIAFPYLPFHTTFEAI
jgi:hypothetical protein